MRMIEGHEQPWDGSGYTRMVSRALGITEPEANESLSSFVRRKSEAKETQEKLQKAAKEMKLLAERYGRSDIRAADLLEHFVELEDFDSLRDAGTRLEEGSRIAFDLIGMGVVAISFMAMVFGSLFLCCRCCCCRRRKPVTAANSSTGEGVAVATVSKKKKKKRNATGGGKA